MFKNNYTNGTPRSVADELPAFATYCATLMTFFCIFGVFGNSLSLCVFTHRRMIKMSINVLLAALSAVDLVLLLLGLATLALPLFGTLEFYVWYTALALDVGYPALATLKTVSIWLLVLITIERYLAVCRPLLVRLYCTPHRARLAIAVLLFSSILYNLPKFFEEHIVGIDWLSFTWILSIAFVNYFIPLALLVALNGMVIMTLIKENRRRSHVSKNVVKEHKTAVMMLAVIGLFVVCFCPMGLYCFVMLLIYYFAHGNYFENGYPALFVYWATVNQVLLTLNSASTFLVYLAFSSRYRFYFKQALCCTANYSEYYSVRKRIRSYSAEQDVML